MSCRTFPSESVPTMARVVDDLDTQSLRRAFMAYADIIGFILGVGVAAAVWADFVEASVKTGFKVAAKTRSKVSSVTADAALLEVMSL